MQIRISYPLSQNCLLKQGQKVDFNTPYLEKKVFFEVEIPVAKKLEISGDHIFRYLKKFIGENISKGEVLACKKGIFRDRKIISDYDGIVKEINHEKGCIIISAKEEKTDTIKAYFKGEVLEIKKGEVLLKVKKGKEFPLKSSKSNFGGEVFYLEEKDFYLVSDQLLNKILVSRQISSYLQIKLETLGITGFVLLKQLPERSQLNFAQLKNIDDIKKIRELNLPYCLVNKENGTIFFYQ